MSRLPCPRSLYEFRPSEPIENDGCSIGEGSHSGRRAPCVAYLELAEIGILRRRKLEPPIDRRFRTNLPTFRIYKQRMRRLTPANPLNDAYLAGLLIALAQTRRASESQRECEQLHRGRCRKVIKVRRPLTLGRLAVWCLRGFTDRHAPFPPRQVALILTDWYNCDCFHLYSAGVPAPFFQKLDTPDDAGPASGSSLEIERQSVSFQPFETLRERLITALVSKLSEPAVPSGESEQCCPVVPETVASVATDSY